MAPSMEEKEKPLQKPASLFRQSSIPYTEHYDPHHNALGIPLTNLARRKDESKSELRKSEIQSHKEMASQFFEKAARNYFTIKETAKDYSPSQKRKMEQLHKIIDSDKRNRSISIEPSSKYHEQTVEKKLESRQTDGSSNERASEESLKNHANPQGTDYPSKSSRKYSEAQLGSEKKRPTHLKIMHKKLELKEKDDFQTYDLNNQKNPKPKDVKLVLPDDTNYKSMLNFMESLKEVMNLPVSCQMPKSSSNKPQVHLEGDAQPNAIDFVEELSKIGEQNAKKGVPKSEAPANIDEKARPAGDINVKRCVVRDREKKYAISKNWSKLDIKYLTVGNFHRENELKAVSSIIKGPPTCPVKNEDGRTREAGQYRMGRRFRPLNDETADLIKKSIKQLVNFNAATERARLKQDSDSSDSTPKEILRIKDNLGSTEAVALTPSLKSFAEERLGLSVGDVMFVEPNTIPSNVYHYDM